MRTRVREISRSISLNSGNSKFTQNISKIWSTVFWNGILLWDPHLRILISPIYDEIRERRYLIKKKGRGTIKNFKKKKFFENNPFALISNFYFIFCIYFSRWWDIEVTKKYKWVFIQLLIIFFFKINIIIKIINNSFI